MTTEPKQYGGQTPVVEATLQRLTYEARPLHETMEAFGGEHVTPLEAEYISDAVWLGQENTGQRHGVSRGTIATICHRHKELYNQLRDIKDHLTEHTLKAVEYYGAAKLLELVARKDRLESVREGQQLASIVSKVSVVLDHMAVRRRKDIIPMTPVYDDDVSAGLLAAKAVTPTLQE